MPFSTWCMLLPHRAALACSRAAFNDGSRIATSRAMIATTTSTSMSVNPMRDVRLTSINLTIAPLSKRSPAARGIRGNRRSRYATEELVQIERADGGVSIAIEATAAGRHRTDGSGIAALKRREIIAIHIAVAVRVGKGRIARLEGRHG